MKPVQFLAGLLLSMLAAGAGATPPAAEVDFNRDIRPIFSKNCFACHGPDETSRQADFRLDRKADVLAEQDGTAIVRPGDPQQSELYRRITAADEEERMPPVDSGRSLTPDQIDLIGAWIRQGAAWENHWSFIPPRRPSVPKVRQNDWPRDPIDYFVLARLEFEGLRPSPEAPRPTLIRRVTLDLTGLPPTSQEVDAFLADISPDAYEKVVDRLLASHRFGERMALDWMDAARYADTHGYHEDKPRDMWPWRDWVIDAFNHNMPFDQFTIEQLAGDLLPGATQDQRTATGFNRNHGVTGSGIAEEYRVAYVIDRVKTTSTVWMGLTLGCAQCHDHKYDPIPQEEFYRFFAFFNTIPDRGIEDKSGNVVPLIELHPRDHAEKRAAYRRRIAELEQQLVARASQVGPELARWEKDVQVQAAQEPPPPGDMTAHFPLDATTGESVFNTVVGDSGGTIVGKEDWTSGYSGSALGFDGATYVDLGDTAAWESTDAFSYGAWIYPTSSGAVIARMEDEAAYRGYDVYMKDKRLEVHIIHHWPDNALHVVTDEVVETEKWQHVLVTYDGSSKAGGIRVYVNGVPQNLEVTHDTLTGTIQTDQPLHIGRRNPSGFFQGRIDDVRFYRRQLNDADVAVLAHLNPVAHLLAISPQHRSEEQTAALRRYYLEYQDQTYQGLDRQIAALKKQDAALDANLPTVMVMQEMGQPRDTFVLRRGQYDQPDASVEPGTPSCLPPLPSRAAANRLDMARWLVDPGHPLTSRVAANRLWQMALGTGIVRTAEDFGSQGERPTHPELLDWLAVEFVEIGWDTKALLKRIVMSATYRQDSTISAELMARDPENRLLARGPRYRLAAEPIRDSVLAISGLLVERVGGPSVKSYQPQGLWREVAIQTYEQDHGEKLYRRSLYTYRKRQVPPPNLAALDAPNREFCVVRRSRTNTPLQALVMMNDPTFVEAARAIAQRAMVEAPQGAEDRTEFMFRLATARRPTHAEREVLLNVYREQLAVYRDDMDAAAELLAVGESPRDESLDAAEHAAWATVASLIINLDEFMTKE